MNEPTSIDGAVCKPAPILPKRTARELAMPAVRFVAAYTLLTALMYAWGDGYGNSWCKPFAAAIAAFAATVAVDGVSAAEVGRQHVFILQARSRNVIQTTRGAVPAGIELQSTTLQAYAHHHLILIFSVLAAWPVRRPIGRAALLAAGIPAVAIATMLDLPVTLFGAVQDLILAASIPHRPDDFSMLYFHSLQSGGRHALSLAAAGLAIVFVGQAVGGDPSDPDPEEGSPLRRQCAVSPVLLSQNHH